MIFFQIHMRVSIELLQPRLPPPQAALKTDLKTTENLKGGHGRQFFVGLLVQ